MNTPASEGPELWNYDALEQRSFSEGMVLLVLRRTLEVVLIEFDANPAVAANMVLAVQTVETFLAEGAPEGCPRALGAQLREHLLALRRPGPSTLVKVAATLEAPENFQLLSFSFELGDEPKEVPVPGPGYAGLYGLPASGPRQHSLRMLARPGISHAIATATVLGPSSRAGARQETAHAKWEQDLSLASGQCLSLALTVVATAWPDLEIAPTSPEKKPGDSRSDVITKAPESALQTPLPWLARCVLVRYGEAR